jgi:hypothetical protein
MGYYMNDYGDGNPDEPDAEFADVDDLLEQWGLYLNSEMQVFKVIRSDLYGSGCVCDLKTMFLENNFTPDFVMNLNPRVRDCYTNCLNAEYNKYLSMFLSAYTNMSGVPMSVSDLGDDEQFFYKKFVEVAHDKTIFNSWDLWSTKKSRPS